MGKLWSSDKDILNLVESGRLWLLLMFPKGFNNLLYYFQNFRKQRQTVQIPPHQHKILYGILTISWFLTILDQNHKLTGDFWYIIWYWHPLGSRGAKKYLLIIPRSQTRRNPIQNGVERTTAFNPLPIQGNSLHLFSIRHKHKLKLYKL